MTQHEFSFRTAKFDCVSCLSLSEQLPQHNGMQLAPGIHLPVFENPALCPGGSVSEAPVCPLEVLSFSITYIMRPPVFSVACCWLQGMWIKHEITSVDPTKGNSVKVQFLPCEGGYQCREFTSCTKTANTSGLPQEHLNLMPLCRDGNASGNACINMQMNAGTRLHPSPFRLAWIYFVHSFDLLIVH